MNIEVDTFSTEYRFLVQPHVTIERIFCRVASSLHLEHRELFGLQAYNEWHQAVVWMKPTDSLSVAIQKGMRFKPFAVRLFLRANAYPADWDTIRNDHAALQLFYKQASERFQQQGYRPDSTAEIALVALVLLIEQGPLIIAATAATVPQLMQLATRHLVLTGTDSILANRVAQTVLQLWHLFGPMTATEATFNYLNILAGAGYCYEKIRFTVKNHKEKKPADLDISFSGLEVIQPGIDGHTDVLSFPWAMIRTVNQRKQWITVRLFDRKTGPLIFMANCQFAARRVYSLVQTYHREHLHRFSVHKMTPSARLMISQPENFFDSILRNLVALDCFSKQLSVGPIGSGEVHQEWSDSESQVEELQSAPQQLDTIIEGLVSWIELYRANLDENETIGKNVNQLFALLTTIHKQINTSEVFENPASIELNSVQKPEIDDKVLDEMQEANQMPVNQLDFDEDLMEDFQIETTVADEPQTNELVHLMVPVEVHSNSVADSSTPPPDAEVAVMQNSSESGDDLVSDHSADFSVKNPKLVLRKSLSQQQSTNFENTAELVVMSQIGNCLEEILETIVTEETDTGNQNGEKNDNTVIGGGPPDEDNANGDVQVSPVDIERRKRFAGMRLRLFEH